MKSLLSLASALAFLGLFASACVSPSSSESALELRVGWTTVQATDEETARLVLEFLEPIIASHSFTFEETPDGLLIRVLNAATDAELEYDSFDHTTNTIKMQWWHEDPAYNRWLLAHELAHAYQFATDPDAYIEEPSWIHEGWAEYAAWVYLTSDVPEEGREFLHSQAAAYLESGTALRLAIRNVYTYDASYPTSFLTVHYLAGEFGEASVADYFRIHGEGRPHQAVREFFGRPISDLAAAVDEHARALLRTAD